ncbi:MAG: helix-turn-helix transcriptional regulator, partial [Akkermansia sp.]
KASPRIINTVRIMSHNFNSTSTETMENKKYVPIDLSKNKRYATVEDALKDCVSPEIMEEAKRIAIASTVSSALAHMRVKAGISQNMMAAALNCSQPRISAIESATNDKMSMPSVLKYVEVTGLPFKAQLEDGRVIAVSSVPKGRKTRKSMLRKPIKPKTKTVSV